MKRVHVFQGRDLGIWTRVVWISSGWLVTDYHSQYGSDGGTAICSIIVPDPAHSINPEDFKFEEEADR